MLRPGRTALVALTLLVLATGVSSCGDGEAADRADRPNELPSSGIPTDEPGLLYESEVERGDVDPADDPYEEDLLPSDAAEADSGLETPGALETMTSASVGDLAALAADGVTPLVRTDFSDDAAWTALVGRLSAPDAATAEEGFDGYEALLAVVTDPRYEGWSAERLAKAWPETEFGGYVAIADRVGMADPDDLTITYLDLTDEPGRTFRCAADEFASIEANLSIANMDFFEFADHVGPDGVFRGFAD